MNRPHLDPHSPCRIEGCHEPRMVTPSGKRMTLCVAHQRAYYNAANAESRARRKAGMTGKRGRPLKGAQAPQVTVLNVSARLRGRPRKPTMVLDARAGVVRRIVRNTVEREFPLPADGLRAETLLILKRRGWQIRVG